MNFAGMEWIILLLAIVILIFGAKKIPEFARSLGRAKAEFTRGKLQVEREIREMEDEIDKEQTSSSKKKKTSKTSKHISKIIKAARDLGIDTKGKTETQLKREIAKIVGGVAL